LASGDLNARARISQAAEAIGATWEATSLDGLQDALDERSFDLLILDLDADTTNALDAVAAARSRGSLPQEVIGYYSHVDAEAAQRAREASITPVRRGRFWTQLTNYLSDR
jgi:CheY-like chemotaxis protein